MEAKLAEGLDTLAVVAALCRSEDLESLHITPVDVAVQLLHAQTVGAA